MAKPPVNLEDLSVEELNEWHDRVMEAKGKKAIEAQNQLIAEYQVLRQKMIDAGVVPEDQLPRLKRRGWTRTPGGAKAN